MLSLIESPRVMTRAAFKVTLPPSEVMSPETVKLPVPLGGLASMAFKLNVLFGDNNSPELTSMLPATVALRLWKPLALSALKFKLIWLMSFSNSPSNKPFNSGNLLTELELLTFKRATDSPSSLNAKPLIDRLRAPPVGYAGRSLV